MRACFPFLLQSARFPPRADGAAFSLGCRVGHCDRVSSSLRRGPQRAQLSLHLTPFCSLVCTETAGLRPTGPDRGGEEDPDRRGLPHPHQTAPDKIRGEGAEENQEENQE